MRVAILIGLVVVMTGTTALAQSSRTTRRPYSGTDPYDSKSFDPPKNPYDSSNYESRRPRDRYDALSSGGIVDQAVRNAQRQSGSAPRPTSRVIQPSSDNAVFGSPRRRSNESCVFSNCR